VSGLAERKRQVVRDALAEAALRVLAWHGFETTTVDQIVAEAGVSRRTFFRYFRSKDDVVVQFLGDVGAQLCEALAARPASEPPSVALRQALSVFVAACAEHPEKSLALTKLVWGTPALVGSFLERQAQWRVDIAAELGRRGGLDPDTDLRPSLAAAVALAAFDAALHRWSDTDGAESLDELTDQAIAAVAPALDASAP
jgi:AcrR family transcriptional regulator